MCLTLLFRYAPSSKTAQMLLTATNHFADAVQFSLTEPKAYDKIISELAKAYGIHSIFLLSITF